MGVSRRVQSGWTETAFYFGRRDGTCPLDLLVIFARAAMRAAALCAVMLSAVPAFAQDYPDRPVRIIVGFAPGGSSDVVARLVSQHLSPLLGQPVIVENRAGVGGTLGSDIVAKAAPDGHTLLLATAGHATAAAIMRKLPFDSVKDFAWITTLTTYPFLIVTRPESPISSLADLISRAKAAPGRISFATTGIGAAQHMLPEWFSAETGIEMLHVPFKGGTAVVTEIMTGRVDLMFETMTLTQPYVKSGKLRALAVTSREPVSFLPDVPAAAQTVPGFVFQSWLGLAAPAATPAGIVDRLNRDVRRVLGEPEVQKRFADLGGSATPSTPDELRKQVEAEIARWHNTVDSRRIERQ
jgi:tripartite-type tricarboxylate transporter receptor subunit TctC